MPRRSGTGRTRGSRELPEARLPARPHAAPFCSDEANKVLRLSSKSHWDVPVRIGGMGVFWPAESEPGADLIDASDHCLVWIDVALSDCRSQPSSPLPSDTD